MTVMVVELLAVVVRHCCYVMSEFGARNRSTYPVATDLDPLGLRGERGGVGCLTVWLSSPASDTRRKKDRWRRVWAEGVGGGGGGAGEGDLIVTQPPHVKRNTEKLSPFDTNRTLASWGYG